MRRLYILFFTGLLIFSNACKQEAPAEVAVVTAVPVAQSTEPPPTATNTTVPTATPTTTVTHAPTPIPTFTPTATVTPSPTSTPIGGQVRAYNQRYIYLDDGHEEPYQISLPSNKLTLRGYANFPIWSPDYHWLATLQTWQNWQGWHPEERVLLNSGTLYISNSSGSETVELGQLSFPDISNCIALETRGCQPIGDYIYQGNFIVWSPDSTKIAYLNYLDHDTTSSRPIRFEIMVVSITGGEPIKVGETTFAWNDTAFDMRPLAWSPDGVQIAYTSYSDEDFGLHIVNADGSDSRRVLAQRYLSLPYWNNDGQSILMKQAQSLFSSEWSINGAQHAVFVPTSGQLIQVNSDGTNFRTIIDYSVQEPILSPDGMQVAYVYREQLKVLTLADLSERVVASVCGYGGGYRLRWSPDSQAIAFQTREVLERNGQTGCAYNFTRYVGVYSVQGEKISIISYMTSGTGQPSFSFSPDSQWFAAAHVREFEYPSIYLVDMLNGMTSDTRIQSPIDGLIAWQAKY